MRRQRCEVDRCPRFATRGRLCSVHASARAATNAPELTPPAAFAERRAAEADAEAEERAAAFRDKLESGDYRALFGNRLASVMQQAASERGITDEIGALRVVLARLMAEESDPSKLAAGVAKITAVLLQAAKVQRLLSGQVAEGLTDAITQILTELDDDA